MILGAFKHKNALDFEKSWYYNAGVKYVLGTYYTKLHLNLERGKKS